MLERMDRPKEDHTFRLDLPNEVAASHVCVAHPHTLRETPILQLPLGKIAKGRCTSVITIAAAAPLNSMGLLVRDVGGTVIMLTMRNWLPVKGQLSIAEGQAMFPAGTVLRLLEPFLGTSAAGMCALRVDNPANVRILVRPGLTLEAEGSPERAETQATEVLRRGDEHMAADRAAAALDCFSAGLALGEQLPPTLRAALHRRGAAAALKLERFAAALLDCDRALALEPSRPEAALLRCDALIGTGRSAAALTYATQQLARCDRADEPAWTAAVTKARNAESMRAGHLDVTTLPFTLEGQAKHGTATYVGPIAVRDTRTSRGWGVYLTRDVKAHEVLLIERPLYGRVASFHDMSVRSVEAGGEEAPDTNMTAALTHLVQTTGADADSQIAAKLATLFSYYGRRWATEPPSEAALRGEEMLPVPPLSALSARHIRGIVSANCFAADVRTVEDTGLQRAPLAWEFEPDKMKLAMDVRVFAAAQRQQRQVVPATQLQAAAMDDVLTAGMATGDELGGRACPLPGQLDSNKPQGPSKLQQLLASMTPAEVEATIDEQDIYGMTALHYAVEFGRRSDVAALLAAGAGPKGVDNRGWTPLHIAALLRQDEALIADLLDAGADVNAVVPGSDTALYLACTTSTTDPDSRLVGVVRLLLARGADPLIYSSDGGSLLTLLNGRGLHAHRKGLGLDRGDGPAKVAAVNAAGFDWDFYCRRTLSGSSLFWAASFINHARHGEENTWRKTVGGLMVVKALWDMPAGTELTTAYADNAANLARRGIVEAESRSVPPRDSSDSDSGTWR